VAEVDSEYNVALYQQTVSQLIKRLNQQGKLPLLVGGTGLYYQAVVDNYQLFPMESSREVREKYRRQIISEGIDVVYRQLLSVDPDYAQKISPQDENGSFGHWRFMK
jgi:tRNA dimethylallyltransferase